MFVDFKPEVREGLYSVVYIFSDWNDLETEVAYLTFDDLIDLLFEENLLSIDLNFKYSDGTLCLSQVPTGEDRRYYRIDNITKEKAELIETTINERFYKLYGSRGIEVTYK